jgi:hypothetical protein
LPQTTPPAIAHLKEMAISAGGSNSILNGPFQ